MSCSDPVPEFVAHKIGNLLAGRDRDMEKALALARGK
jgi:hypothetical protein